MSRPCIWEQGSVPVSAVPRCARAGWLAFALAAISGSAPACAEPDDVPELTTAADAWEGEAPSEASSDEPCQPSAHSVSGSVAVFGCDAQVDGLTLSEDHEESLDSLAANAGDPLSATTGRRLKDCRWSSFIDSANTMLVMCPGERHVVSGGCFSQATMLNSAPFEFQTAGNLPEQGERYQDLGATSGWMCTYDGPVQSAGQQAAALCCS